MSVSDILQQMAQNAGRARLIKGGIYGNLVASAAEIPGQIANQREADALQARGNARLNAADARAAAQDARQIAEDRRASQADEYKHIVAQGLAAAVGDGSDPTKFDGQAAFSTVKQLGHPEAIRDVIAAHREMLPKYTAGAAGSVLRDEAGQVVPGSAIPEKSIPFNLPPGETRYSGEGAPIVTAPAAPVKPPGPGTVHDTANGLVRIGEDNSITPLGVKGYHPPTATQINNAAAAAPPSKAEIAMANYMVPTPSPRSFATPAGKAMMDRILTVNPDFDASKYSVRAPTRKAFTTGMQGQQITAMNTAVEHLDQLQAAAEALKNGNFKPGNAAYQYLKETFGSNAPTNYDTIKAMVDKEVEAVANKGVPTVAGTAEQKALAGKSAGPAQLKGYIDTLIPLMGSKLNALHYQYKQAMGENDPFHVLTPEAEAILTKRGFDPTNPTVRAGAGAAPAALAPPPTGRIRIVGPGGATGTILATDQIPAGWSKQ